MVPLYLLHFIVVQQNFLSFQKMKQLAKKRKWGHKGGSHKGKAKVIAVLYGAAVVMAALLVVLYLLLICNIQE